jgi:chromosome segregation ATPase
MTCAHGNRPLKRCVWVDSLDGFMERLGRFDRQESEVIALRQQLALVEGELSRAQEERRDLAAAAEEANDELQRLEQRRVEQVGPHERDQRQCHHSDASGSVSAWSWNECGRIGPA